MNASYSRRGFLSVSIVFTVLVSLGVACTTPAPAPTSVPIAAPPAPTLTSIPVTATREPKPACLTPR